MHPGLASFLTLDGDAVDRDIIGAGREVAEAEREADYSWAHGLSGFDRAGHDLANSLCDLELAGQVGRAGDLDLLAFA